MEPFLDIRRNPKVMFPGRDAFKHVQKTLQNSGAVDRDRTGDLFLTKEVLYQLSYNGLPFQTTKRTKPVTFR